MDSGSIKYIPEAPYEVALAPQGGSPVFSRKNLVIAGVALLAVLACLYRAFIATAPYMQSDIVITVEKGDTLSGVAEKLSEARTIRSRVAFKALVIFFSGSKGLQAGDYYFAEPQNAVRIAWRLTHSSYQLKNVRVTIPEGTNSIETADILAKQKNLTHFVKKDFLKIAAPYEGYLFPDTYFLMPNVTAQDVVDLMLDTYKMRIKALEKDIVAFGRPISDVIKMASIIEEEARTDETREIIAGILWKRLDEGMPLQVDAAFAFVNGKKDSRYISSEDLKIDSPYNTYVKKGLPPTPISNPGLDAIRATVHPIKTSYYFYLSDKDGNMRYAVTHDQHVLNKQKYLNYYPSVDSSDITAP